MKIARASAVLFLTYLASTLSLQVTPTAWGQSAGGDPHDAPLPKEKPSAPALPSSYGKLPLSFEALPGIPREPVASACSRRNSLAGWSVAPHLAFGMWVSALEIRSFIRDRAFHG
jgi:hypothetical protein